MQVGTAQGAGGAGGTAGPEFLQFLKGGACKALGEAGTSLGHSLPMSASDPPGRAVLGQCEASGDLGQSTREDPLTGGKTEARSPFSAVWRRVWDPLSPMLCAEAGPSPAAHVLYREEILGEAILGSV